MPWPAGTGPAIPAGSASAEISCKRGHRRLTVVVGHDSGLLLWAAAGRGEATLRRFFELLGEERRAAIILVSAGAARWIAGVAAARCPQATIRMDPFHVIQRATRAPDQVRRAVRNEARRSGQPAMATDPGGARCAPWKNPEDLTGRRQAKLAGVQRANERLPRGYPLKGTAAPGVPPPRQEGG